MIDISRLTKRFGTFTAVDDVSFSVERGEVLGFLGPNGAGKSTTMKMITGFIAPTSGRVTVAGHDSASDPIAAKSEIGYLPEGAPAYPDMHVAGFLEFVAEIRGLAGATKTNRIAEVVRMVHLEDVLRQPIETLSKGFKRRVGLAQAIVHDPPVLIMDEPTDGLDPNQKQEVRTLIRSMAAEKAIVLSTHILEEVDAVCSRAIIIDRGRIVVDGTPQELEAHSRYHNAVDVRVSEGDANLVRAELERLAGVQSVEPGEGRAQFTVFPSKGVQVVDAVAALLHERGWPVEELHQRRGRMDEVFRSLTGENAQAPTETAPASAPPPAAEEREAVQSGQGGAA